MKYLALLAVFALVGCGASAEAQVLSPPSHYQVEYIQEAFTYRVIDAEAGIVCYLSRNGGSSCLPLSETKLDK